jgi:hypothetical protein
MFEKCSEPINDQENRIGQTGPAMYKPQGLIPPRAKLRHIVKAYFRKCSSAFISKKKVLLMLVAEK